MTRKQIIEQIVFHILTGKSAPEIQTDTVLEALVDTFLYYRDEFPPCISVHEVPCVEQWDGTWKIDLPPPQEKLPDGVKAKTITIEMHPIKIPDHRYVLAGFCFEDGRFFVGVGSYGRAQIADQTSGTVPFDLFHPFYGNDT